VVTGPRNFYTKRGKGGKDDSVYFSRQSYLCTGDLYKARSTAGLRTIEKDGFKRGGHDFNFKPAKNPREKLYKQPYEYMPLKQNQGKKNFKDEEGRVITGPRNFTTIPMKRGKVGRLTYFGGQIPYKEDDVYGNKKKIIKQEIEYHRSKVQEKPFSQQAKRLKFGTFNNPKNVYGEDRPMPPKREKVSQSAVELPDVPVEPMHDKAFKPSGPKKGVHPTIGAHPPYMPNPPRELKRKVIVEGEEEERPRFKLTYNLRSRPCPSVATNYRNLKASFPSAFSLR